MYELFVTVTHIEWERMTDDERLVCVEEGRAKHFHLSVALESDFEPLRRECQKRLDSYHLFVEELVVRNAENYAAFSEARKAPDELELREFLLFYFELISIEEGDRDIEINRLWMCDFLRSERDDWGDIDDEDLLQSVIDSLRATVRYSKSSGTLNPVRPVSRLFANKLVTQNAFSLPNNNTYQALRKWLALKGFGSDGNSSLPTVRFHEKFVTGLAQLKPTSDSVLPAAEMDRLMRSMWQHRESLSDFDVDVLDALCAMWIQGASHPDAKVAVHIDDVLRLRGTTPKLGGQGRRGGYELEQRANVFASIERLECVWFDVVELDVRGKKGKREKLQSRAVIVTDRTGQERFDGGFDVTFFLFQPGGIFSRYLFGAGRQTALLSAKVLRYNSRTHAIEKRLARFLSWQWRIRSRHASYAEPYTVHTLIEEAGIAIPSRNIYKIRERLEKALNRLQQDEIIANWQWDEWTDEDENSRHGASQWLSKCKVKVEPPGLIKEHYPHQAVLNRKPCRIECASLAEQIKSERKERGLSQMQVADQIGISQQTLSRIESGAKASITVHDMVQKWLAREARLS